MKITQISVFLENKAGQLSQITSALAEKNIDLRAVNIAETADYGVLRIIPGNAAEASSALLEKGFIISMNYVTAVKIPDEPGSLNSLLLALSKEGIDIEYMYSMLTADGKEAEMIIQTKDAEKTAAALTKRGF